MRNMNNLVVRGLKWKYQNPITLLMSLIQPLMWLLLFATMFGSRQEGYIDFILGGILLMTVLSGAGMSGISNYYTRENGSYYRLLISPIKRQTIVWGHAAENMLSSFIQTGVILLLAFLLGVRIRTGLLGFLCLLLLLAVTAIAVAVFSYWLSHLIPDENGFIAAVNTFTLPLFFLSSALMEPTALSRIFQYFVLLNPFTHVINALRNVILGQVLDWSCYGLALILSCCLAAAALGLATRTLDRQG